MPALFIRPSLFCNYWDVTWPELIRSLRLSLLSSSRSPKRAKLCSAYSSEYSSSLNLGYDVWFCLSSADRVAEMGAFRKSLYKDAVFTCSKFLAPPLSFHLLSGCSLTYSTTLYGKCIYISLPLHWTRGGFWNLISFFFFSQSDIQK